jgi:hypothetical protein
MRYEHRETRIQCVHSRIIDMLVAAVKSAFQKHPQVTARQTNVLCRQLKSRRLQRPVATDRNDLHFNMVMSIPCTSSAEAKRQLSVLLATTSYTNEPCRTPCLTRLLVSTCRVRACFGRPSRFTTGDGCGFDGSRPSTRWNLHARDEMDETRRVAG